MAEKQQTQASSEEKAADATAEAPVAPWPKYDEQTADEVKAALKDVAPDTAAAVAAYEAANKNRSSVIEAANNPDPTVEDAQYSRQQLIENGPLLLDAAPSVVDVALRRFGTGDFFNIEDAKKAVDQFNAHEVEEA